MRTILIALFLIVFAIISIPLYLVEFIIGKFSKRAQARFAQSLVRNSFKIILFLAGAKVKVIGRENVPSDEAVLYVSNHRSYFDVLLAYTTVPTLTGFVAKKQMSKVPCISIWMKYMNCLFLDRENIREGLKTILQGIENIKNGYSMFIAPEGTRNQNKEMLPFKEGSFKLAEKSGCKIIPVSISNTEALYENQAPWVHKGKVVIEFGQPINMKELDKESRKHIGSHVQNIIKETLEKNEPLINK